MKHAIDHLVLVVRDLDAARDFYERLGFTLTPRAQHPFGTANHLAQLQGNFLELLAVAEPERVPEAAPGEFSFGAYNRDFLARHQGMSMLVFPSEDARRDRDTFAARGLASYAPYDFSRTARLPDGRSVTVAFSLAFATHPEMPDAAFFVCQQHAPQYFWKMEYQRHANGARSVVEVLMLAEAPGRLGNFFARLLEPGLVREESSTLRVALEGGSLSVLDPGQFRARYGAGGAGLDAAAGPRFAGYRVAVERLETAAGILGRNGVRFQRAGNVLRIAPTDAFGVLIEFAAMGDAS